MAVSTFLTVVAGLVGLLALGVYLFGIPPELKRKMEKAALKTMGENKASYLVKDQISKVPEADQQEFKDVKKGLSNLAGGGLQNPAGEAGGELADNLTSPFTGR